MKDYVEKEHNTLDKYWWNTYWEVCRKNGIKIKTEVTFQEKKSHNRGQIRGNFLCEWSRKKSFKSYQVSKASQLYPKKAQEA